MQDEFKSQRIEANEKSQKQEQRIVELNQKIEELNQQIISNSAKCQEAEGKLRNAQLKEDSNYKLERDLKNQKEIFDNEKREHAEQRQTKD